MGHTRHTVDVAETVLGVAHLTWSAVEHLHHNNQSNSDSNSNSDSTLEDLRKENKRLKEKLEQNLKLLHLSSSPCLTSDFPPDLHERLVAAVDSNSFLARFESLHNGSVNGTKTEFPFKEPTEVDLESAGCLINVDQEEPSWWVWVTDEMVPATVEERSGLDDENYVIVCEEHVVDGVANVIARCIVSNPKLQKLTPEQLQKTVAKSLGGMNKVEKMMDIWHAGKLFYTLSTWGLAFAGLYQSRAALELAAHGVDKTSRLVLKSL